MIDRKARHNVKKAKAKLIKKEARICVNYN